MKSITKFFSIEEKDYTLPLIVSGIGNNYIQEDIARPNGYDKYRLIWTVEGSGIFVNNRMKIPMDENRVMLLIKNESHHYYPVRKLWIVNWVTFDGIGIERILEYLNINSTLSFGNIGAAAFMRNLIDSMNLSSYRAKPDLSFNTMNYLNSLAKLNQESDKLSLVKSQHKMKRVLDYIDNNFDTIITLRLLADIAEISQQHLCVLFKEALHLRPFEYINNIRLNHSKTLLIQNKDMPVSVIAERCGYENICYFNQVFKKRTGMSPTRFRQLN